MNKIEIMQHVTRMVNDRDLEKFSQAELGGLVIHALENNELPERAMQALILVAACLMKDHSDDVEKDVLAVRDIYQRR